MILKRKFIVVILVVALLVTCFVSASAYTIDKQGIKTYYLYRDFEQIGVSDDGLIMRLKADLNNNFQAVSGITPEGRIDNFLTVTGPSSSWYGRTDSSYWINNWPLGMPNGGNDWMPNNIHLSGFKSNTNITIGYSLTGANIDVDHHDIWVYYYDDNNNFVRSIQYSTPNITNDGDLFLAQVPIFTGGVTVTENGQSVLKVPTRFAILLQIDDIIPIQNGTISFTLNSLAFTTTGSSQGYIEDALTRPANPVKPDYDGDLSDLVDKENNLITNIIDGLSAGMGFLNDAVEYISNITGTLATVAGLFIVFINMPFVTNLLLISLSLGFLAALLNIPIGHIAGRQVSNELGREKGKYESGDRWTSKYFHTHGKFESR